MKGNLKSALSPHLDADESLLWVGRPKQGIRLQTSDAIMIPFSLMWGGFAIFWELSSISMGTPFFFNVWGIPFVLVGIYLIIGRFFYDAKRREKTIYGITEKRIIIKSGVFSSSFQSLNLKTLSNITLHEKADQSGTIVLGNEYRNSAFFRGTGWPGTSGKMVPALEMIDNVGRVYRKISELQNKL